MERDIRRKQRAPDPSLVGTTLVGRYHLVRMLGDGGMGAVYKAADQVLRRFVAIKLLHPATAENPSAVERFVREARSAAAIGHPNIIDILDFGYEKKRPFLVMEYLRGRSLSELIAEENRLTIERACKIATHSLAGLAAAHDRGILHRDLKPANLMLIALLGDADFVKVCDFGFAALVQPSKRISDGKELTPARTLVGTPAYAAPERLRGDDRRDPRIDVYSIGVVLFEMLAGRRPFDAPTFRELARKVRHDPPPKLRAIRADVPKGLEYAIERSLAKDREERWASCEEFAAALVPFGGRVIPVEDHPSDSFTMDLLRIKARETAQQKVMTPSEAEQILELRRRFRKERREDEPQPGLHGTQPGGPSIELDLEDALPMSSPSATSLRETDSNRAVVAQTDPAPPMPGSLLPDKTEPIGAGFAPAPPITAVDPRSYAGSVALSILRFVSRRFGERALTELLGHLPDGARQVFHQGVTEDDRVPFDAVNALISCIDARLGRDDLHLVVQCGRAAAEGAFELMRAVRPPSPPPEVLLAEMPQVIGELVAGVDVKVSRLGRGYGRMELDENGESSLSFNVFLIGFVDRSLDRFGASDVEVNMLSSPALGDDSCVYEISWIS
ncbi:MAG TPA: serine/threonine-protein kinase [Polyangiaceae bacterium LLY-WYZ-15_(1-7)]|nr:serine/threonine-protein kinase [Polyangiaceae bacterium LLY-WYZ-15_(1-7)]HJL04929.1 serine/threonine-protein kinase [Polyangiaceae bacterium LLY-WYZ-15_(1-7)]HJL11552.1 serine/threonine-protein kinase [Polyangiaceae bacterium LLY-WYZ-15_(1-7)]HJL21099.1 serine/threonine-protein kinase [Polyangiaceae bacterium LLY-WYZ-15_(1-7)]